MHSNVTQALKQLKQQRPLVYNLTNLVVSNNTANAILAIGASPIMSNAIEEAKELTQIAQSIVINTGTVTADTLQTMQCAARTATEHNKPWILDPVGVGATTFRRRCNLDLLSYKPTVVRGNAAEIHALFSEDAYQGKGVDGELDIKAQLTLINRYAKQHQLIIAITGATDYVCDGEQIIALNNGHAMMAYVTGSGCTATALIGAFLAVSAPLLATIAALTCLNIAGELAAIDCNGPGSLQLRLLDALYQLDDCTITQYAQIEHHQ